MESIVEQIAKEVMLKLKSDSANRGSAYTPPPQRNLDSARPVKAGQTAVLLAANFKVVDQVLGQLSAIAPGGSKLIVSSYLYENYGKDSVGRGYSLIHSGVVPSHKALDGISQLLIPSLSINSLSKAANLIADTYITRVLCHAIGDGVKITICDESILDASRYFPAGVARKIDKLRRELEDMGVVFQRCGNVKVTPGHKCSGCAAGDCASCTTCTPSLLKQPEPAAPRKFTDPAPIKPMASRAEDACSLDCSKSYGSCVSFCAEKVKGVIKAGADRIEKGLEAPMPSRDLAKYIDHTLLKPNTTREEIIKLCEEAREYSFASVCVNPSYVALSAKMLEGCPVKVCTVIGFPLGATSSFVKATETRDAVANGATEIDMVINVGALKSKDYELVKQDISRVVEAACGNTVKVILETSLLTDEEKVKACELSKLAGADFVKTSTGFSTGGATLEDICLMRQTVGPNMGVKASGGIRDTETAMNMIQLGATRIGASASVGIVKGEKAGGKGY
jgi:deoxyribose-phosphate aldolase